MIKCTFMQLQCRENMLLLFTPLDIFNLIKSRFSNNIWHMRLKRADVCVWSAHYLKNTSVSVCECESDMKRPERVCVSYTGSN